MPDLKEFLLKTDPEALLKYVEHLERTAASPQAPEAPEVTEESAAALAETAEKAPNGKRKKKQQRKIIQTNTLHPMKQNIVNGFLRYSRSEMPFKTVESSNSYIAKEYKKRAGKSTMRGSTFQAYLDQLLPALKELEEERILLRSDTGYTLNKEDFEFAETAHIDGPNPPVQGQLQLVTMAR